MILPGNCGSQKITPLSSHRRALKITDVFLEGVCIYIWHLSIHGSHPRDEPQHCLALIAKVACICESHWTLANKREVINRYRNTWPLAAIHMSSAQRKKTTTKKPFCQFLFGSALTKYFHSYLKICHPISLHRGADCDPPFWDTDRS